MLECVPIEKNKSHPPPFISVVIPTYNRAELLLATLESLCRQSLPKNRYEVIVADDGSTDETEKTVRSFADRLHVRYVFQEDEGFRAGQARNLGVGLATAPLVAFLDTGVLVGADWLRAHLAAHSGPGVRKVVVGYLFNNNHGNSQLRLSDVMDTSAEEVRDKFSGCSAFTDVRLHEIERMGYEINREGFAWYFCWSANLSVPRVELLQIGGFDTDFKGWGAEDVDLARRLQQNGCLIEWDETAWGVEAPHGRAVETNWESCRRNTLLLHKKNPTPQSELFWAVNQFGTTKTLLDEWELVSKSVDPARLSEKQGELDEFSILLEDRPHARVAVIGAGENLPTSWSHTSSRFTLIECEPHAPGIVTDGAAREGFHRVNAIGLRTPFPDDSFDLVLLSSGLRDLWPRWGDQFLAEAARIGGDICEKATQHD